MSASNEVANDLILANQKGQEAFKFFIHESLVEKTVKFHAPISRLSLKTFAVM